VREWGGKENGARNSRNPRNKKGNSENQKSKRPAQTCREKLKRKGRKNVTMHAYGKHRKRNQQTKESEKQEKVKKKEGVQKKKIGARGKKRAHTGKKRRGKYLKQEDRGRVDVAKKGNTTLS